MTTPITRTEFDAIAARLAAAPDGPWAPLKNESEHDPREYGWIGDAFRLPVVEYMGCGEHAAVWASGAKEFVLAAPTDMATLQRALTESMEDLAHVLGSLDDAGPPCGDCERARARLAAWGPVGLDRMVKP